MDGITNYYESLVFACIQQKLQGKPESRDDEYVADLACIALNQLPARYVRHLVDTRFFESKQDIVKSNAVVSAAVDASISFLDSRRGLVPDGTVVASNAVTSS